MSRHKTRSDTRKRSRSRKSRSTVESEEDRTGETTEEITDNSNPKYTNSEDSTPRPRNRTSHRSKSRDHRRRNSSEDDRHSREHRHHTKRRNSTENISRHKKITSKKHTNMKKSEPSRTILQLNNNDAVDNKLNHNRMVSIRSPSIDIYEHLISITTSDTSEIPPTLKPPKPSKKTTHEGKSSHQSSKVRNSSGIASPKRRNSLDKKPPRRSYSKLSPRSKPPHKSKTKKIRDEHVRSSSDVTVPSCPLCFKKYGCPILLNCSHTFCKDCVSSLVEISDGKSFYCPVCSTRIELMGTDEELFCPNFVILHQIESANNNTEYLCSVCDAENEADHYCENCSDLLCASCVDAHQVVKYTKEHAIKQIKPDADMTEYTKKKYFCPKHDKEILDIFCTNCEQSLCRICVLRHHHGNNHKCIPIENAIKACREELKRRSYNHTSQIPKLRLALLDVKRLKKTLTEQVMAVHTDVTESVKRIINKLKDSERDLHKKIDVVYNSKLNRIKTKKEVIKNNIKKFEAVNELLSDLSKHENEVELLQMKVTMAKTLSSLEKDQRDLTLEKETFLLKSNEGKILSEINKHGQIYRVEGPSGPMALRYPSSLPTCSYFKKEENSVIISDFEDNASSYSGSFKNINVVATKALSLSKARSLRARANWLVIRARLKDIVKYGYSRGYNVRRPKLRSQSELFANRLRRTKAKMLKAKAYWFILKSNIPEVAKQKNPPKLALPRIKTSDAADVWRGYAQRKINRRRMRTTAIKNRAKANWLLVRSHIRNIVDYGRINGNITFGLMQVVSPSMYERSRESKTILKLKRYRAMRLRAQANWLLVNSRIKDIVNHNKKKCKRNDESNIRNWNDYRRDLLHNRDKAAENKQTAGRLRARANWLIVKTRLPEINLFGLYQEYERNQNGLMLSKTEKQTSPAKNCSTSPVESNMSVNRNQARSESPPKFNWDKWDEMTGIAPKESQSQGDKPPKISNKKAKSNWENMIAKTATISKSKSVGTLNRFESKNVTDWHELVSGPIRGEKAKHNWDNLIGNMSKLNKSKSKSDESLQKKKQEKAGAVALESWDAMLGSLRKTKDYDKKQNTLSNADKLSDVSSTTKQTDDALMHWDKIVRSTSSPTTSAIYKSIRQKKKSNVLKPNIEPEELTMKQRDNIAERGWDVLISGTDSEVYDKQRAKNHWHKVKISMGKAQSNDSIEEIEKKWDYLISKTKIDKKIKNSTKKHKNNIQEAFNNWHNLIKSINVTNEMIAFKHWNHLVDATEVHEPLVVDEDENKDKNDLAASTQAELSQKHWNTLISSVSPTDVEGAHKNWSRLVSSIDLDNPNEEEALQNWDVLLNSKPKKSTEEALKSWDRLIDGSIVKSKRKPEPDRNWDVLLAIDQPVVSHNANNEKVKSPSPSKRSRTSTNSNAFRNWNKLLKTPPLPREKNAEKAPEIVSHTGDAMSSLINDSIGSRDGLAFDNWNLLLKGDKVQFENHNSHKPPGVKKLYEKGQDTLQCNENKVLSLNIRNSKGEFHNVNLKLASPDRSILSAHVAENSDGTFTIFCCPRIDNDFNMYCSLSGDQFKHEIKVVNFYGSFAGLRKHETDLACRTISLLRWHLTPGLLTKKGDKVVARKGSLK